ncbi:hypothetical protein C0992_002792 [Termitomyces sp. T32_za158]|nr:hypothetical protein C0992_002792 [Termitomyces sp. T32_za158]
MAKPTILQSLLGRPSQAYSFPEEKVYHSNKRDMRRIAAETREEHALVDDDQPGTVKQFNGVRAYDDTQIPNCDDAHGVNHTDDGSDGDSGYDVFYTPNTSPRISTVSTDVVPLKASSLRPSPQLAVPSTKTSFAHTNTSTTSISSSALDSHSLFSLSNSESTLMTSPIQSESEHISARVKTVQEQPQIARGHVNQEWAKDVRWLVPTTAKATTTTTNGHQYTKGESAVKSQTRSKPHTSVSKTMSKTTPSIMASMTALLEEDELLDAPTPHHPRSNILISPPRRSGRSRVPSNPNHTSTSSKKSSSTRNTLHRRRSRSLDHASHASSSSRHTPTSVSTSSHIPSPLRNSTYASSSIDPYDRNITSLPIFTTGDLPSQGTPGYTSLVLPRAPVPLSQTSQRPKSIFNFKDAHHGADINGKVDLTRSGVAQTTMASVEVVRGLSQASSNPYSTPSRKLIGLFRRASTSASSSSGPSSAVESRTRSQDKKGKGPEIEALDLPLGFTSYRKPPAYVPSGSVLVQVWAVGIDGLDWRLVFGTNSCDTGCLSHSNSLGATSKSRTSTETPPTTPKRSVSLRSTLGRLGGSRAQRSAPSSPVTKHASTPSASESTPAAVMGYIPGRSFVGRVLECGWEVREEVIKKGDWVIGLLDLRKCGALTEFIVVDRHRVHRAPYPRMQQDGLPSIPKAAPNAPTSQSSSILDTEQGSSNSSRSSSSQPLSRSNGGILQGSNDVWTSPSHVLLERALPLSLEELALLPACGIPAYRAVRTFAFAFSDATTEVIGDINTKRMARDALDGTRRRRVLVLRGHDGAGALAVQMLVRRGWRVCVHVPLMCLHDEDGLPDGDVDHTDEWDKRRMRRVEERVRAWGGEEVIFDDGGEGDGERGAVARVIDRLREDGDIFDAVLDTIGGREVWEAAERLLKTVKVDGKDKMKPTGLRIKQFTTLVGDFPGRTIPSAGDTFKAGLRSLNFGSRTDGKKLEGKIGYAWVSHVQDVDWEGEDIRDTLREVLRVVTETGIRPWVGEGGRWTDRTNKHRVVPFEKAHELFIRRGNGILTNGGSCVVKVVG